MDLFFEFVNSCIENISEFIIYVVSLLPSSPFKDFDFSPISPFLSGLNWLIPVGKIVGMLKLWLGAVGLYYIYSIVLRWIKAIE